MSEEPRDLFGKIDALTGRRIGFGPSQDASELDDFPLLTDVVPADEGEASWEFAPDAGAPSVAKAAWASEGYAAEDTAPVTEAPSGTAGGVLHDPLPPHLRAHIEALFASQERRLEAMLRRVLREELERFMQARGTGRSPL